MQGSLASSNHIQSQVSDGPMKKNSLALQSISEATQLAYRDRESGSDALDGAPGWVGVAALDQGEGAGRYVGLVGEIFLGDAALLTKLADRFA